MQYINCKLFLKLCLDCYYYMLFNFCIKYNIDNWNKLNIIYIYICIIITNESHNSLTGWE